MRALMENPEQRRMVLEDPSLVPAVVEESLRMFPAFAHFARTATRDTELHGQRIREGETLGTPTYVESAFASQLKTLPLRLDCSIPPAFTGSKPAVRINRSTSSPARSSSVA
jgi:hypothetical protein